ncbi:VOC family protein [Lachnospiraceae bacterium C1.1]|nr:hypothetical protein [Lachnospiraceae bacterium C1.1]
MKITSFNPLIVSKNGEDIVKLFEELGFEKRHTNENIGGKEIVNVTMKDANGFHVDVTCTDNIERDISIIRMNVDDFDEAVEFLKARGFTCPSGRVVETPSSKSCMMVSPSGFGFDLCHHIKK